MIEVVVETQNILHVSVGVVLKKRVGKYGGFRKLGLVS